MNQDSTATARPPNEPRTASRRPNGADAEIGSSPASGPGWFGADVLLDPLRLNDAMRQLGSRLAADPSPFVGPWFGG